MLDQSKDGLLICVCHLFQNGLSLLEQFYILSRTKLEESDSTHPATQEGHVYYI